jgi:CheY-like chemotaxis protein
VESEGQGRRILVVDDDADVRDVIVDALRLAPGQYEIETACDGLDAGMKLERFGPEVVILDVNMPGMDGLEMCELIRRRAELDGTKILVLTAYPEEGRAEKSLFYGADLFLTKPQPIDTLLAHIEDLLDR